MPDYCLNKNSQPKSGDYEVHSLAHGACNHLPAAENRIALGHHLKCQDAVAAAKAKYPGSAKQINGCYYCCNACHTS